jgi:hypothetical protein
MLTADIQKLTHICSHCMCSSVCTHPHELYTSFMLDHDIREVLDMTSCILHNVFIGRPSGCSRAYRDTRSMFPAKIKTYMNEKKSSWVTSHIQMDLLTFWRLSSLSRADIMSDTTTHCIYTHRTLFWMPQTRHC